MIDANVRIPTPVNEPVLPFAPGSPEKTVLKKALERMAGEKIEIPLLIGGKEVRTGKTIDVRMPHRHQHVLATAHEGDASHVEQAIAAAQAARAHWSETPFAERAADFPKAARLLPTQDRPQVNASNLLGQGKTAPQAEIDPACESIDLLKVNVALASELHAQQPQSAPGMWNMTDYRPLD